MYQTDIDFINLRTMLWILKKTKTYQPDNGFMPSNKIAEHPNRIGSFDSWKRWIICKLNWLAVEKTSWWWPNGHSPPQELAQINKSGISWHYSCVYTTPASWAESMAVCRHAHLMLKRNFVTWTLVSWKQMIQISKAPSKTYNCLVWPLGNITCLLKFYHIQKSEIASASPDVWTQPRQENGHRFYNEQTSQWQPAQWNKYGIKAQCPSHDYNDQLIWTEQIMWPQWHPSDILKLQPGMAYKQTNYLFSNGSMHWTQSVLRYPPVSRGCWTDQVHSLPRQTNHRKGVLK